MTIFKPRIQCVTLLALGPCKEQRVFLFVIWQEPGQAGVHASDWSHVYPWMQLPDRICVHVVCRSYAILQYHMHADVLVMWLWALARVLGGSPEGGPPAWGSECQASNHISLDGEVIILFPCSVVEGGRQTTTSWYSHFSPTCAH